MNPYENLANAIIMQAVKEYRRTRHEGTHRELERFFRSEWFKVLTIADGNYIIKMLRKEQAQ